MMRRNRKKMEIGSHLGFWRSFWNFLSDSLTLEPELFHRPLPSNWHWKQNFCINLKWLSAWAPHYFLSVSHCNRISILNRFRDICIHIYLGHDFDLSRSRDHLIPQVPFPIGAVM